MADSLLLQNINNNLTSINNNLIDMNGRLGSVEGTQDLMKGDLERIKDHYENCPVIGRLETHKDNTAKLEKRLIVLETKDAPKTSKKTWRDILTHPNVKYILIVLAGLLTAAGVATPQF